MSNWRFWYAGVIILLAVFYVAVTEADAVSEQRCYGSGVCMSWEYHSWDVGMVGKGSCCYDTFWCEEGV